MTPNKPNALTASGLARTKSGLLVAVGVFVALSWDILVIREWSPVVGGAVATFLTFVVVFVPSSIQVSSARFGRAVTRRLALRAYGLFGAFTLANLILVFINAPTLVIALLAAVQALGALVLALMIGREKTL